MSVVAWDDSAPWPYQIQLPSCHSVKAWPHSHHCFWGALWIRNPGVGSVHPLLPEACRSQREELLHGGWVVARG